MFSSREAYQPLPSMQVDIQSLLSGPLSGSIAIDTNPEANVESLISSFCAQKGVAYNPHLTIFDNGNRPLVHSATLESEGINDGAVLYLGNKRKADEISGTRWGLFSAIAFIIGGGGLLAASLLYGLTGGEIPFDYGIVVDAGSTHTQVYLYRWLGSKQMGTAKVAQEDTCTKNGGIAKLPDPAAIIPCVEKVVNSIPGISRTHTPLFLGATAGMRLLNLTNPRETELILLTLQYALVETGVVVKTVDVITGHDEGIFAWITTNFLKKTLTKEGYEPWNATFGALDMGGASTQIAYAVNPSRKNSSDVINVKLYGQTYSLFAKSYLCYGMVEALNRYKVLLVQDPDLKDHIYDPCQPKGNITKIKASELFDQPCTQTPKYLKWLQEDPKNKDKVFIFEGGSDYENCMIQVSQMMNTTACQSEGFLECFEPFDKPLVEEMFMAFSSFYYIPAFLNSTNATLNEFRNVTKKFCELTWDEMKIMPFKKEDLMHILIYCFGANYMTKWLTTVYGFNSSSWSNIIFQNKIENTDVGWSLGFMINATNAIPEEAPTSSVISTGTFAILLLLCLLILALGVILVRKACHNRTLCSVPRHRRLIEA